jgi:predicted Zn-dependent protease
VTLIEEGTFIQPLLGWWDERPGCRSGGCSRRDSWRDQPVLGTSHLYLKPDEAVRAGDLLSSLSRGYYLLDSAPAPEIDFGNDRFSLEVSGFEILGGTARSPIRGVRLTGKVSALLSGLRQVARDLTFHATPGGLIGSPTVRFAGLELRGAS